MQFSDNEIIALLFGTSLSEPRGMYVFLQPASSAPTSLPRPRQLFETLFLRRSFRARGRRSAWWLRPPHSKNFLHALPGYDLPPTCPSSRKHCRPCPICRMGYGQAANYLLQSNQKSDYHSLEGLPPDARTYCPRDNPTRALSSLIFPIPPQSADDVPSILNRHTHQTNRRRQPENWA